MTQKGKVVLLAIALLYAGFAGFVINWSKNPVITFVISAAFITFGAWVFDMLYDAVKDYFDPEAQKIKQANRILDQDPHLYSSQEEVGNEKPLTPIQKVLQRRAAGDFSHPNHGEFPTLTPVDENRKTTE